MATYMVPYKADDSLVLESTIITLMYVRSFRSIG